MYRAFGVVCGAWCGCAFVAGSNVCLSLGVCVCVFVSVSVSVFVFVCAFVCRRLNHVQRRLPFRAFTHSGHHIVGGFLIHGVCHRLRQSHQPNLKAVSLSGFPSAQRGCLSGFDSIRGLSFLPWLSLHPQFVTRRWFLICL
jgi:hypothetical protein